MQLEVVENQSRTVQHFRPGDNLLEVLNRNGSVVHAPCGGWGTCHKCWVDVTGVGRVLACRTDLTAEFLALASQPMTVTLPDKTNAQISTDGILPDSILEPLICKGSVQLTPPTLDDQRPDDERFENATGLTMPFHLLGQLPEALRSSGFAPSFYFRVGQGGQPGETLRFVRADSPEPLGVAVDIGTTTLAAYLYDLGSGQRLAAASALNPQSVYGADVISRIDKASSSPEMRGSLKKCICDAIADLASQLVRRAGKNGRAASVNDICHYVLAGNTTMMHLLTGMPADAIARAPFIPASRQTLTVTAAELGLPVAADAICQLLPAIASYVGSDITAGILACDLLREGDGGKLLLDIGTNGEIVAAGPHGAVACSTAAGPAFEGANIRCGIGGVSGAIDEVAWNGFDLTYTVIGDNGNPALARGICGSGLVAAVASLLACGLLEETGRITDYTEALPESLLRRIIEVDGQPAVVIAHADECADGQPIFLTQKDIRELQNAKAAIAAGIELLIDRAGLTPDKIDHAYIAGGFGNYLDVMHAFRIGLLPKGLMGRTRAVGNTSGMGAILCLLAASSLGRAKDIAQTVDYFELSGDKRFVDLYVDAMMFPESES